MVRERLKDAHSLVVITSDSLAGGAMTLVTLSGMTGAGTMQESSFGGNLR